jgi:hypothetical protein
MRYVVINRTGEDNLREWLCGVLKDGSTFANAWADSLVSNFDGSRPDQSHIVEVGGFHTASGRPETYQFGNDEIDEFVESD